MRLRKLKMSLVALMLIGSASVMLASCKSNVDEIATTTHGSKAGDGYTYGTGPNKTRPYPQSEPVNINKVGGVKPKYEPVSRGGNKDYTVLGQNYMVWTDCRSYQEVGTASWYGPGFHGNKTSNGEVYDQKGFSAAHKNLPLPSYLKVTNLENGRAVIVRVNDRGPFHGSRIIDLSEGAAKAIDMTKKGTAKVKLELIDVRGEGNISTSNKPGQSPNIVGGILGEVFKRNTSTKTQNSLKNIDNFAQEMKHNGGASFGTTVAAIGGALQIAQAIDDSGVFDEPVSSNSRSAPAPASRSTLAPAAAPAPASTTTTTTTTSNTTITYAPSAPVVTRTYTNDVYQEIGHPIDANANFSQAPAVAVVNITVPPGTAFIQFFSSTSESKAHAIKANLQGRTPYPIIVVAEEGLYRVRIGPVPDVELLTSLEYMKQLGYADSFIKRVK